MLKLVDLIKLSECKNEMPKLKSGINILDIGCRDGNSWWELFEELHFSNIIGIDKCSQEEISDNGTVPTISYNTFKMVQKSSNVTLSEDEFNKIFLFKQIDIDDFFFNGYFFKQ